jgi:hypothetical protein
MALEPGNDAPDFTLPDQEGNPVTLSELRGKTVVLYFYPKADTPGCTTQACGVRDHSPDYERAGAVVLGVSPDPVKRIPSSPTSTRSAFRCWPTRITPSQRRMASGSRSPCTGAPTWGTSERRL